MACAEEARREPASQQKRRSIVTDKKKEKAEKAVAIEIKPPNMNTICIPIVGIAPLCVHAFGAKAKQELMETQAQEKGTTTKGKGKKGRKPKTAEEYQRLYHDARHISTDGWDGIAASAFRNACIDVAILAGYVKTRAKLSFFVEPDGFDESDGTPLVHIQGDPEMWISHVRLSTGVIDLHARPLFKKWKAAVMVTYDADQFAAESVMNLMWRAGVQSGVGEGRPNSKMSSGIGLGHFKIDKEATAYSR